MQKRNLLRNQLLFIERSLSFSITKRSINYVIDPADKDIIYK